MRMSRGLILGLSLMLASVSHSEPVSADNFLHLNWIDSTTNPKDNFYLYANGEWKKQNPIPAEYSSWNVFSILQQHNQTVVHNLLIEASKKGVAKPGSLEQKVGDFYYSGMDVSSINKQGLAPVKPLFAHIESINSLETLQSVIAYLHLNGVDALFSFGSMQDFKHSTHMIAAIVQGGLTLPDRDYYLKDDKKFKLIREAYSAHIVAMLRLYGESEKEAHEDAAAVLKLETALAKASMSQIAMRDPHAIYHVMSLKEIQAKTPHFSWRKYLTAMDMAQLKEINLATPEFMQTADNLLVTLPIKEWKAYLRWHLLTDLASYLSTPFVNENFHMASVLTGTEKILPRWKQVINTENGALGFAIGKLYAARYFSEADKLKVTEMIHEIDDVLKNDLKTISWMEPKTREAAVKKLSKMEKRVGYPDKWWDYSNLKINRGPYVLNVLRASKFLVKRDLNKIGKPVDRDEWEITPQTVNAYYDPSMNSINIPMGILQPPFFDPNAPAALNYGSIGFIIGHEITHGFDDQGAKFDGDGNLVNWWTPSDLEKFNAATKCIVNQFSNYKVNGDVAVQGPLVVGEATADLGGLILAYRAFHASEAYKTAKTLNGLTPDQQFFLGAAHVWANNIRKEQALNYILIDPHAPAQYRVNGTLANMPQFQEAFNIPFDSVMVNKNRCVIW